MYENLKKLYLHYGGISALFRSSYFWVALIFSTISYRSIFNADWADIALGVMPSLTGFTLAAFAIIFAILEPSLIRKLMTPGRKGTSPIISVSASIGHAIAIQVFSMVLAAIFKVANLSVLVTFIKNWIISFGYSADVFLVSVRWITNIFSGLGLVLTFYGLLLVLAAVLSIFRMQLIVAESLSGKQPVPPSAPPL